MRCSWTVGFLGVDMTASYCADREFSPLTDVERQGLAWVDLLVSGKVTASDIAAFEQWRGQSPAHAEALEDAVALHKLAAVRGVRDTDRYTPSVLERVASRRAVIGGAMAASVAGYAMLKPPAELWPSWRELSADYRTKVGEQREVALGKSLSVAMNTQTSIGMRTGYGQPAVEVIAGEIAVTASLGSAHQFVAYAGDGRVVASDASFDLMRRDGDTCVTCLQGAIAVVAGGQRRELQAGQQIIYSADGLRQPVHVAADVVSAWRHGQIIFHNARLRDVVAEINRYRPGKIVIVNSSLAERRFSGDFMIKDIQYAVGQVQESANASAVKLPGGVVLLS